MLSLTGFLTIGVILALLLTSRVAAVVALAGAPVIGGLAAGFSPAELGEFAGAGLEGVVGVATMFVFAIVYFGVMRDAGMFDPVIRGIVRFAGNAPATVCLATTTLAAAAHLDGAGATTFLITIPAMLPIFDRLGMRRLVLATCVGLGAGVMNLLPWGGPTARAATTTGAEANDLWVPLIPAQLAGLVAVLAIAWFLGRREQRRLRAERVSVPGRAAGGLDAAEERVGSDIVGGTGGSGGAEERAGSGADIPGEPAGAGGGVATGAGGGGTTSVTTGEATGADGGVATDAGGGVATGPATGEATGEDTTLRRPRLLWFNVVLTVATIAGLIVDVAPPELLFLVAVVIALLVNYPGLKRQTDRIEAHAKGAMLMATTLLSAGVFLGILGGTGMIDAMATTAAEAVPDSAAPALPLLVGLLGVPMSLLFGPDAFYFGVLPVLIGVGEQFGVDGTAIAQASLLGEETVGFPISPLTGSFYLLVGLAGVDIGRHIRHLIGWAWLVSVVMLAVAFATGAIPVWAG